MTGLSSIRLSLRSNLGSRKACQIRCPTSVPSEFEWQVSAIDGSPKSNFVTVIPTGDLSVLRSISGM